MRLLNISNTLNNPILKTQKNFSQPKYIAFNGVANEISGEVTKTESKFLAPMKKFFKPATDKFNKAYESATDLMAKGFAKYILDTDAAKWVVEKTKNVKMLPLHLSALTSTTLSLFYMKKTLDNKNLDPQKKTTLAINQGSVAALSTVLSYSLTMMFDKKVEAFTEKFLAVNSSATPELKAIYKNGIKTAAALMIFQSIFRYVAPVVVTPFANHIGNKLQEKKEAEKLGKKQND